MINLTVVIDNEEALKKLKELQNIAKTTTSSVVKDSERMDASFQQMKNTLAGLTAGVSFAALAKQVVQVRGEVQQLEVAFETMLGSKQKADTLMTEIIDLAAKTPFGLQDVSNATKMLLAYGSTAESVADEIKMLGNIASGLSIPLNDMIYLYGTTRTQGRMFTQDLRQFMGRGIPLAEELAKQFGVTKDKVGELVTAGKVGFDEMAKALQAMTSEGGKFNNLMDKQSQTITGQISNLQDSIYQMFNEIGKSSEGVISDMISGASWVVEHYQSILKVLSPLIAAYGAYKTAIIVVAAAQKAMALGRSIAMFIDLAKAITSAKDAMLLLNMATNANPLGILLSVLAAIGVAVWQFSKGTEDAARQMGALEKAAYDEYIEVNRLIGRLRDANLGEEDRVNIINQLKTINPSLIEGLDNEATAMDTLTKNLKAYNEEQIKRIQLGTLQDQHGEKLAGLANAELQYTQMKAEMDAAISKLVADYQLTGKLPEIDASWNSVYNENEVATGLKSVLDEAIAGTLSGDELARQLYLTTTPSGVDNSKNVTIKGFDIGRMTKQVNDYKKAVDEAQKEVASSSQNMQEVMKRLGLTPEPDKSLEDNNTTKELTEDEKKAAEKRAKELAELKIKLRKDAEQAEIDAMADGTDKKIAQIKLDYEKRKQAIEKEQADLIAKQGKPLSVEQQGAFDALHKGNKVQATEEWEAYVEAQVEAAGVTLRAKEEALKAEKKARAEYLIEYGNYEEKRLAIAEKYAMLIADATNEWDRKGLENERDNALAELDNAMSEKSSLWVRLFEDASKMTKKQIKSIIAETKQLLDYLNGASTTKPLGFTDEQLKVLKEQPEAIKAIYDELMEKQAELDAKTQYPFHNIIKALEKLKEAQKEAKKAVEATTKEAREAALVKSQALKSEAEKNIYEAAGKASQSVLSLAEAYNKLAEATGDERIKEASAQLGAMAQNFAAAGQGAASGGWIGAIVGGVTDMLTQTIDAIATNKSEQYELLQNTEDFVRKYKLALLSLNDDDYDSIFGVNSIEKMQDAYRKAQEALEAYYASVYKQLDLPEDDKEARSWGGLIFSGFLWLGERTTELQNALRDAFMKGYDALEGMQVKTLDRSGWANFWGAKDEYTSLKDLAPELWNEDGTLNIEAAEAFLATNTQITEEQRKQIQNVIDLHKQYEDLDAQIEDQLRSIFGDLAGDVTDIIFDAVRNGTDAWDAFGEKGSEIIDKLGRQMIQQVFVQSYFERYAEELKAAYASENPQEELARITAKMFDGIGPMLDAASAAAIEWDNNAEAMGYGPSQSNQLTTYAKGFQTMSQETGSELNGRFTDIQGQTHRIAEAVEFCKSLHLDNLSQVQSINTTVAMIHNDTSLIAQHTKALLGIREDIDVIRRSMDNGII